ncbi:MAG: transcriptional repressor LexA [Firmicutes bacterium]|nr:transcriptional repressor LexA [Bacillota bacterium]
MQVMKESKILQVLTFIQQRTMETGRTPSYREIMKQCNLASIGQVQRCIKVLKERGELDSDNDGKVTVPIFSGNSVSVPLIGTIACGQPIFAIENYEGVYRLPEEITGRSGDFFMLRAKGDSMTGVGIRNNDLLIFREQPSADYGDVVAAIIEDEATVKTYQPNKANIVLRAENPQHSDIVVKHEDCRIIGILVGSFHKHK